MVLAVVDGHRLRSRSQRESNEKEGQGGFFQPFRLACMVIGGGNNLNVSMLCVMLVFVARMQKYIFFQNWQNKPPRQF
ncbi:MAG: hypothetical protein IJ760_08875 [Bacteroidales bacterium]|nr:hypothetical protein [Bacteroidales bacterium]MBR1785531.1 hypothetical protein [Bacteroidales bacterium]